MACLRDRGEDFTSVKGSTVVNNGMAAGEIKKGGERFTHPRWKPNLLSCPVLVFHLAHIPECRRAGTAPYGSGSEKIGSVDHEASSACKKFPK